MGSVQHPAWAAGEDLSWVRRVRECVLWARDAERYAIEGQALLGHRMGALETSIAIEHANRTWAMAVRWLLTEAAEGEP